MSEFQSPCCHSEMLDSGPDLACEACGEVFSREDGIARFALGDNQHGEFSPEEMREFLSASKMHGWRAALDLYAKHRQSRVVRLISDPRRASSVEPLLGLKGGKVLDFGCGYGAVSLQLAKSFGEVVSIDGSINRLSFLNIVRQQDGVANIVPVWHDQPANLPFPDNYFDAALLIGVLEYLPETLTDANPRDAHRRVLREFKRVLRPGGVLLIETKNRFGWQYILGAKDHTGMRFAPVLPIWLADILLCWKTGRQYRIVNYSLRGYRTLLEGCGFSGLVFAWPLPSYQNPDYVLRLGPELRKELMRIDEGYHSPSKTMVLKFLAATRLLKFFVPFFRIVATKP